MPVRDVDIAGEFEAALPLMRRNWAETGFAFPFAPSREMYEAAQAAGMLIAKGAMADGELVGYSTAVLTRHPFNPDVRVCASDALFMHPGHRAGALPGRLMLATEVEAQQRGARFMLWHTRAGTPLARTLARRGYVEADVVMMKEL